MSDPGTEFLATALEELETSISLVRPEQAHLPTPCPDYDVARLIDHIVGWARTFSARLTGGEPVTDHDDYRAGPDPARELHEAAQGIVESYREATEQSQQLPLGVLLQEYLTHGWDLAAATGQTMSCNEAAAELALASGRAMLKPEYRGAGKAFGDEVEALATATALDRLVAFMGRDPGWTAPPA